MDLVQKWTLAISLVGAAAWIPQLLNYAINYFKKPIVNLIPSALCQIGFTELGPIFNLKLAITADNQSVLLSLIEFDLTHEDTGAKHIFKWHEIVEIKGQMFIAGMSGQSISHEVEAVAIKILTTDFKDVFLKNRLENHTEGVISLDYELSKERRRLESSNQYNPEQFYASAIMRNMELFMKSQMIWRKGTYKIKVSLKSNLDIKLICPEMSFSLADEDVLLLQSNSDSISKYLKNTCYVTAQMLDKVEKNNWHWITKKINKS